MTRVSLLALCLAAVPSFSPAQTPVTTPELVLVCAQDAPESVQFAAEELARYIAEASGCRPQRTASPSWGSPLSLGLFAQPEAPGVAPPLPSSPDEEAYRIHAQGQGGGIFFSGRSPRAVLYAVYDFLETELGYRWYFPYPEDAVAPNLDAKALADLLLRPIDREESPAFSFREREFRDVMPMTEATDARIVQQIDWWAKLRMNRFLLNFGYAANSDLWQRWKTVLIPEIKRRGMLVGIGEHGSYPMFLPPARYAEKHPEWYCEIEGKRIPNMQGNQFCTTNADAVAAYLENFADFVAENPEIDFYYPAPNDVSRWCECATCRTASVADRYMRLDNQVAAMLQRVHPGARVMHLAYSNHRLPPEDTLPHPMIDVDVACWGRDFSYALDDPRTMPGNQDYLEVFRKWAALCQDVPGAVRPRLVYHCKLMRHYWLGLHLTPLPILDADFAAARALGLDGFDFPLGFVGIWTKGLNSYAVARKCWDPDTPAASAVDAFFSDCYGEKAPEARTAYGLIEEAFQDKHYGSGLQLAWHPDSLRVRDSIRPGLKESAANAVAKLNDALDIALNHSKDPGAVSARFAKLAAVIRNARDEQEVLVKLDALMQAIHDHRAAQSTGESAHHLEEARQAWQEAKAANDTLAERYRVEEDLAGLYWAGSAYEGIGRALEEWKDVVARVTWTGLGDWKTTDFPESNEAIVKTFDVTQHIAAAVGEEELRLQVKFVYDSGELGASPKAASLWRQKPDGTAALLCEDRHSGFAGYVHENAVYFLTADGPLDPTGQYLLKTELSAYSTKGRVADRGCNGKILLGLPSE